MTRRLARLALGLYPLAWRRRYGEEMRALLDETPPRAATVLDLARGALVAHLRAPRSTDDVLDAGDRLRATASAQLACWVVFAAAGFGFYKTTENAPFAAHRLLGGTHAAVQALAVIASAAVLVGALPLILTALAQARRRPDLRRLVALPVIAVAVFAALTAALVLAAHATTPRRTSIAAHGAFIAWELAALACGAVCVVGARRALFAVSVDRRWLLTALASGTVVTAAMVLITIAVVIHAIALPIATPALAAEPNGPLALTSTAVSLVEQAIVMAIAAALAVTTTRRGWRYAL